MDERQTINGCFTTGYTGVGAHAGSFSNTENIKFNAQNSNSIYRLNTVQTASLKVLYLIKL